MNKLIVILAAVILVYLLWRWTKKRQVEVAQQVPIDSLGVVIEPNPAQANEVVGDITGLI